MSTIDTVVTTLLSVALLAMCAWAIGVLFRHHQFVKQARRGCPHGHVFFHHGIDVAHLGPIAVDCGLVPVVEALHDAGCIVVRSCMGGPAHWDHVPEGTPVPDASLTFAHRTDLSQVRALLGAAAMTRGATDLGWRILGDPSRAHSKTTIVGPWQWRRAPIRWSARRPDVTFPFTDVALLEAVVAGGVMSWSEVPSGLGQSGEPQLVQ